MLVGVVMLLCICAGCVAVWGGLSIVAVVLLCFMLCLYFSVFWNGLGMLWRLLDVRGEPPPVLASLSSIVCLPLSLLLNVGMVRMCIVVDV